MRPSIETQRGFPYRRRLFLARHRRRSIWLRLAKPFLGALLLVGSPAALAAWVLTSPEFSVQQISVVTGERVSERWVREALAGLKGASMFEISTPEVEWLMAGHPWVRGVSVRKRLPDHLHIEIQERHPVALFRQRGELSLVDEEGEVFTAFDPNNAPSDLLVLSGDSAPAALLAALEIADRLTSVEPEWGMALSEVEILNGREFRLHSAAWPFPIIVSGDRLERALSELRGYLPRLHEHLAQIGAIDLRFERYIVIKPVKER